jgi:hypothetical protein
MDAPANLIEMINNLPVIDYSKARSLQNQNTIERCPTGAIVWIDEEKGVVKGSESKKIIRKGELRMGSS